MNYSFTALICLLAFNFSFAQPIIDINWFYVAGEITNTSYYYPEVSIPPENGWDIVWDISDAPEPFGDRTIQYLLPEVMVYGDEFSDAIMGYQLPSEREVFIGWTDGNLHEVGYRSPNIKRTYTDGFPLLAFNNFEYGTIASSSYTINTVNFSTMDTTNFIQEDELTYAGFGTVITPIGTYGNCVMTKLERTNPQRTYVEYRFYQDNLINLIATHLNYPDGTTEPATSIHYKINPSNTSSLEPEANLQFEGPIDQALFLTTVNPFDANIQIIDVAGKVVAKQNLQMNAGRNEIKLSQLSPNQVYFLMVVDKDSGDFQTYKFFN